ncbi:MAG: transporter substrate-binding domain-containing protein [Burkholderiales bacterium]|nr:transporter substrate-binding domain-containing protein [Burkholderiales bacterium]
MRVSVLAITRGIFTVLLAACAHVGAAASSARHLSMVATEFPPYTASNVAEQGLVSAIARAAFRVAGYDTSLVIEPWARALAEVKHGAFDVLLAVWYQPEREQFMAFSDPLWTNQIGFYGLRSKPINVSSLKSLSPYTIGVVKDYANPADFDAAHLKTEASVDDLTSIRKLAAGRVDLALVDKTLGQFLLRNEAHNMAGKLQWLDPAVASVPLYITISKSRPGYEHIVADFNRGLAELRRTGEYERIVRRIMPEAAP